MEIISELHESFYDMFTIYVDDDGSMDGSEENEFKTYLTVNKMTIESFCLKKNTSYSMVFKNKKLLKKTIMQRYKRETFRKYIEFCYADEKSTYVFDDSKIFHEHCLVFENRKNVASDVEGMYKFILTDEEFYLVKNFYENLDFDNPCPQDCDHNGLKIILKLLKRFDEPYYYIPIFEILKNFIEVDYVNKDLPSFYGKPDFEDIIKFIKYNIVYLYEYGSNNVFSKTKNMYEGNIKIKKPFMLQCYGVIFWNKKMYSYSHIDRQSYCYITRDDFKKLIQYGEDNNMLISI